MESASAAPAAWQAGTPGPHRCLSGPGVALKLTSPRVEEPNLGPRGSCTFGAEINLIFEGYESDHADSTVATDFADRNDGRKFFI